MYTCNNAWRIEKDFILTKSNGGLHAGLGGINYCFYFLFIFKKRVFSAHVENTQTAKNYLDTLFRFWML